jgi:hypothetical protein
MTTSLEEIRNSFGAVIINWNAERVIVDCVRSFIAGGIDEANIVVIDNGSSDQGLALVQSAFPGIRVLANPVNSYSRAVNLGVASLNMPFVVIANPDLMIEQNCLLFISQIFEVNGAIGAVGCRLTDGEGNDVTRFSHTSVFRAIGLLIIPNRWRGIIRRREQRLNRHEEPFPVKYIEGSFIAVRKAVFDSVHGFDERYAFFSEDSDFSLRLLKSNWKLYHQPLARAKHYCGVSFNKAPQFRLFEFYKSTLLFYKLNYPVRSIFLHAGIVIISIVKLSVLYALRTFNPKWSVAQGECLHFLSEILAHKSNACSYNRSRLKRKS